MRPSVSISGIVRLRDELIGYSVSTMFAIGLLQVGRLGCQNFGVCLFARAKKQEIRR